MAKGFKTGGRKRGTPNRRTVEVAERLAALRCDPIRGMANIAMSKDAPLDLQGRMYAELASYLYPKRKATEHSGYLMHGGLTHEMVEAIDLSVLTDEELAEIRAGRIPKGVLAQLDAMTRNNLPRDGA